MKWQGKLVGVDMDKLRSRVQQACDGVMARAKFTRNMFGTCCSPKISGKEV
jgi:hypothetical protein